GLQLSLFDYRLRNASPVRFTVDGAELRVETLHLAGEDTELDLTGVVDLEDRLLSARASGVANLGIIQGFVRDVRSSGRASVSAEITGALESPTVTGTMTIDQGRIRHFALPHALENIDGVVRFDSRGAVLDGVRARLGGGDVVFGGRIDVAGFLPERVDVTVTGRNMRLRFPEGMRSLVDAELALAGTPDSLVLGGDVLVRSALYSQRFDTGGGVIDFTGGAEVLASTATSLEPTLPIRYDVAITAPGTLRVENNSARISASADLRLEGTYERPLLFGRVDVDRGEVTFEGRRYTVTRGSVDFNNPTRIQPFFDVEADTRVRVPGQTYQITVAAAGTFDRLTPTFSADPPLPEIETIALLLGDVSPGQDVELNRYSTVITPQEQLLRERAARALTGALSAEVGRVAEQTFGVDTFQLNLSVNDLYQQSSRLTPGARLTIGKRLSDRVYLTFSRSLAAAARDQIILLEYDQSERLSWVLSQNEDDTYALEVRVRHVF
ncbi:MAG: translocation/assembly module TamB, partial [Acidimicrobiia bacterium]|nr:translocation/assembly module TamB [Acidimicrobiia bacterium]